MIRFANMNFDELEESDFDRPLGESTGAGVIFGTTGGVIEAAVRTAYEIQTKKTLPKLDFTELRGLAGIRSATIDFDGVPVKIGIAHGWVTPQAGRRDPRRPIALPRHRNHGLSRRLHQRRRATDSTRGSA